MLVLEVPIKLILEFILKSYGNSSRVSVLACQISIKSPSQWLGLGRDLPANSTLRVMDLKINKVKNLLPHILTRIGGRER